MPLSKLSRFAFAALLALPGLSILSVVPMSAYAEQNTMTPAAAITRLFTEAPILPEWFTDAFVEAVPPPRVQRIVTGMTDDFGGLVDIRMDGRAGMIQLEAALVPVEITLDGAGRIAGLFFQPPQPTSAKPEDIAMAILELARGDVSVMAAERRGDSAWWMHVSHRSTEPMAVGSAFKLAVLRAYELAVAEGSVQREDITTLQTEDMSLPSGVLQRMQAGIPITLEALAGLMIQQSDNTATDALIRVLGRDAIEAQSPRNRPFLTTVEFFKLIANGAEDERAAFASGGEAARRQILATLAARPLPDAGDLLLRPTWAEAEWSFAAEELCDLLVSLRDAPALGGSPDPLIAAKDWAWTGFKGGSEFGVLNLSAAGVTPDGRRVCAVVTINAAEAIPDDRVALLFGSLFRSLENAQ